MDPTAIPKKYGGKLDWQWGNPPDLDEETRAALEKDGNKGWVTGPALWMNNKRIVVGSENGKLRRSEKEIAEMKPVILAADYTEEPVHPEKRLSVVSASKKSPELKSPPQGATIMDHPSPLPESPSTLVEDKQLGAPAVVVAEATSAQEPVQPLSPIPSHIPVESVRTSPVGDSQVHLPANQAAPPSTTAEYISPTPSKVNVVAPTASEPTQSHASAASLSHKPASDDLVTEKSQAAQTGATAAATAATSTVPPPSTFSREAASPPPGHAQPGPLSAHTAGIHRAIAQKLEGESIIEIPASANGALAHPDIIATSDAAKGLAMEADKMTLTTGTGRPQPERFVTALEVPH